MSYTCTRLTKTVQIMLWLLDNVTKHRYASAHTYLLIDSSTHAHLQYERQDLNGDVSSNKGFIVLCNKEKKLNLGKRKLKREHWINVSSNPSDEKCVVSINKTH